MNPPSCVEFEEHVDELATSQLPEPDRGRLLAHAGTCSGCRAHLDTVAGLADSMLQLAPRVEPPPGFEARVLERLHVGSGAPTPRWRLVAAIAACVVALLGGVVLGNTVLTGDDSGEGEAASAVNVARAGAIIATDGSLLGTAQLVSGTQPFVLVSIDNPTDRGADVWCELVLASGQFVTVGSWGYDDVAGGVWVAGIDVALLAAVEMRIIAADGSVLATATLDS